MVDLFCKERTFCTKILSRKSFIKELGSVGAPLIGEMTNMHPPF